MSKLTAGIIIIGDEILSGRTNDSNANFIAKQLIKIGVKLSAIIIIPDESKVIIKTVIDFHKKFTYVFTTGGIGPTHDDITSESIAKAFKKKYIIDPRALKIWIWYAVLLIWSSPLIMSEIFSEILCTVMYCIIKLKINMIIIDLNEKN